MGSLAPAIRSTLDCAEVSDLEAVDLYQVAAILKPLFPEYTLGELTKMAAEVAVSQGFRYLIWRPNPEKEPRLPS